MGKNHTSLVRGHLSAVNRKKRKNRGFYVYFAYVSMCVGGLASCVFITLHHTDLSIRVNSSCNVQGGGGISRYWPVTQLGITILSGLPCAYLIPGFWLLPGLPVQCLSDFVCSHGDRRPGFPNSSLHTAYSLDSATVGGFRSAFGMFG